MFGAVKILQSKTFRWITDLRVARHRRKVGHYAQHAPFAWLIKQALQAKCHNLLQSAYILTWHATACSYYPAVQPNLTLQQQLSSI